MRTVARESVFKILFSSQFNSDITDGFKRAVYKADNLDKNDEEYCETILSKVFEHSAEFAEMLDSHSKLFPESRLFPADRSILYLALAEINYMDDVPNAVAVNEAVGIAAKYSSEKSASFVNGLLAEILREGGNV